MERSHDLQIKESPQSCSPILTLGGRVNQGTSLMVLAVAGAGAGLVLGWDSLVALGLSSFILAVLPCAVMCAVGICASRTGKSERAAERTPPAIPRVGLPAAKAVPESEPNTPVPGSRV